MMESMRRVRRVQSERKAVEERLAVGAAALQHLEMSLVNTACDDPGAAIGSQLALPLLQVLPARRQSLFTRLNHLCLFLVTMTHQRAVQPMWSVVEQLSVLGFCIVRS